MRLFIFIGLSFLGITRCLSCIYQVRTRTAQYGGSVTIPCSYASPGEPDEDVRIIWGDTSAESCFSYQKIFSHSGNVIEKYEGRLYREKDPNRTRTEYITITGLKPTDGPTFCCQLYNIKKNYSIQSNTHGTLLHFSDTEYVTQLDELMAVAGEEVIIPCYYSQDTKEITYVSWNFADRASDTCIHRTILESNKAQHNSLYFFVNYTQDISLRIPNTHINDHRSFCCVVSTAQGTVLSKQFTRLIPTEYQSSWDQLTNEISVQEGHSATLTCSHTLHGGRYTERDVLGVNVYWRVGNVTGPYAYHPYQEMVHSTYRHRTSITGMTNLMINDVKTADKTSFHCFVVVKLCAGEDKIQYGGGTRVIVTEHGTSNGNGSDMIIIAVCSVTILIILLVILIVLKVKGVIFKKNKHCSEQQMNTIPVAGDVTCEEAQYSEINTKKPEDIPVNGTDETGSNQIECGQIEDGEDGNVFYAELNKTKLKEKHPAENPKQNEEVVYAAVVKTT